MSALTGVGKIICVDFLDAKLYFILAALAFWAIYLFIRIRQTPGLAKYWGFQFANFTRIFWKLFPFAAGLIVCFIAFGVVRDSLIINWHIIPILLLYPIWGVIQQFLVVGLCAGNLNDNKGIKIPTALIVLITATLFAVVHYPSFMLIGATFLLAIAYTLIYLEDKNLYVLGVYHGWLGGLFYFFVLGRDPWVETFGVLEML